MSGMAGKEAGNHTVHSRVVVPRAVWVIAQLILILLVTAGVAVAGLFTLRLFDLV